MSGCDVTPPMITNVCCNQCDVSQPPSEACIRSSCLAVRIVTNVCCGPNSTFIIVKGVDCVGWVESRIPFIVTNVMHVFSKNMKRNINASKFLWKSRNVRYAVVICTIHNDLLPCYDVDMEVWYDSLCSTTIRFDSVGCQKQLIILENVRSSSPI